MGVVIVFTRPNCTFCTHVVEALRRNIDAVLRRARKGQLGAGGSAGAVEGDRGEGGAGTTNKSHIGGKASGGCSCEDGNREQGVKIDAEKLQARSDSGDAIATTTLELRLETYDCSNSLRAAQCIRVTGGTDTIPHVFFNRDYIGDADTIINLDQNQPERLAEMLLSTARVECVDFPPLPEAALVKVTATEAFSSQPTESQVRGLYMFGFRSVVNLSSTRNTGYLGSEERLATAAGLAYYAQPFERKPDAEARAAWTADTMRILRSAPKPILVHCDTGRRACAIVLLNAARLMNVGYQQVRAWGIDLGTDLHTTSGEYGWVVSYLQAELPGTSDEGGVGTNTSTTKAGE